ncbi:MAG TPA: Rieske 2Fe-2S domain-containing protein [Longimicrobiales bacterium]
MADFETVLRTPELGPGAVAGVQAHGRELAVANVGQTYYAVDATCPVDGTNLAREGRLDGDLLVCPNDHARFDVRTGESVDGDGSLQSHLVRIEGNEIRVGPPRHASDLHR